MSSKDATATYPLKTTSHACPFGGARHTCPTKIQTKLTINQPGDIYEQEADQIAEQAISMLDSFPIDNDTIDRKCADCETNDDEEKKDLNFSRKPSNTSNLKTDEKITSEISSIRSGGGSPLEATTKEFMESRFGYDFSTVRIHSDLSAARTAKALNALAYTTGNDVTFGEGQYSPNTVKGRRLLAHELTHIIQQGTKVKFDEGVIQRQSSPKANPYAGSDKEEAWQQGYKDGLAKPATSLRSPDSYTPDQQQAYQEGSQAANVVSINTETPASAPSTSESRLLAEPPIVVAPPPVPAGHSISPPPPVDRARYHTLCSSSIATQNQAAYNEAANPKNSLGARIGFGVLAVVSAPVARGCRGTCTWSCKCSFMLSKTPVSVWASILVEHPFGYNRANTERLQ